MKLIIKIVVIFFSILGFTFSVLYYLHYSNNKKQLEKYSKNCSKLKKGIQLNIARTELGEFDDIGFTFYTYKPDFIISSIDSVSYRFFLEYPVDDAQSGGVVLEFDPKTNTILSFRCSNPS